MSYANVPPAKSGQQMHRVTITLDEALVADLDALIAARGYHSRSEAIRDMARAGLQQALLEQGAAEHCVAVLIYVYDHAVRDLALRLASLLHDHHDIAVVSTERQLNHDSALVMQLLQGPTHQVRALTDLILTERGVRHGRLFIVPVADRSGTHAHVAGSTHSHIGA